MGILGIIIVGLIAGFLARAILPGRDPMGILGTLVLGIVGAVVGGFGARALGDNDGIGIIGATVGAIVVLAIYRMVTRDRARV
jgi:uncharacterized membrane protein YeaQ/YmgE (transglycosylase-associated protein family)